MLVGANERPVRKQKGHVAVDPLEYHARGARLRLARPASVEFYAQHPRIVLEILTGDEREAAPGRGALAEGGVELTKAPLTYVALASRGEQRERATRRRTDRRQHFS